MASNKAQASILALAAQVWKHNHKGCSQLGGVAKRLFQLGGRVVVGQDIELGAALGAVDAKGAIVAVGHTILQLNGAALRHTEGYKSLKQRVILVRNHSVMHKDLADKAIYKWGVHSVTTEVADARQTVAYLGQTVESALEISATMLHSSTSLASPPSGQ